MQTPSAFCLALHTVSLADDVVSVSAFDAVIMPLVLVPFSINVDGGATANASNSAFLRQRLWRELLLTVELRPDSAHRSLAPPRTLLR